MILEYYSLPHGKHKPVRANPSDAGLDLRYNAEDEAAIVQLVVLASNRG